MKTPAIGVPAGDAGAKGTFLKQTTKRIWLGSWFSWGLRVIRKTDAKSFKKFGELLEGWGTEDHRTDKTHWTYPIYFRPVCFRYCRRARVIFSRRPPCHPSSECQFFRGTIALLDALSSLSINFQAPDSANLIR